MTRPNLDNPEERRAYRRELILLHQGWRRLGLLIVFLAVVALFFRGGGFDTLSLSMLAVGWAILIGVIIARNKYHRARMAEPPAETHQV